MWLDVARYGEDDYREASIRRAAATRRIRTRTCIATGWSRRSTTICPTTSSCARRLPAICSTRTTRARTLPALGFLGLGPWYYDNGAVEITRADERHDRVDVVSRGFLGLTVAARAATITSTIRSSTKDYYALAGVFLNTTYHEYPLAPKSVVDEYDARTRRSRRSRSCSTSSSRSRAAQLSETLALQRVEIHAGGVEGDRRAEEGRRDGSSTRTSSITSCSIAGSSSSPSRRSSIRTSRLAGDDQGGRHGRARPRSSPTSSRPC